MLLRFSALLLLAFTLVGCPSTLRQEKEQRLKVLNETISQSQTVLSEIRAGNIPPKYDFHLFIAHKVLNSALSQLDGYSFSPKEDPSIRFVITSVRIANLGAYPLVTLQGTAERSHLSAQIELVAVLLPPNSPSNVGSLQANIVAFTPKVKWWFFELTKSQFVKALLSLKLTDLTEKLPLIDLPISEAMSFGSDALSKQEQIVTSTPPLSQDGSSLLTDVSFPSTKRDRKLMTTRYLFLQEGIHLWGEIR